MSLLRLISAQGVAGIVASLVLGLLLIIQKGETRHWRKESARFELLHSQEKAALAGTIANYRAAAHAARAADAANLERVAAEQRAINERTSNEYEARLAAARLSARRLRREAASAAADCSACGTAPVSRLSAPAGGPAQGAGQDRLSESDRLLATEQAIQLDELIEWVRKQAAVDPGETQK